jgi:SMI1 / KNR4 family (SUKH-1)
MDTRSNFLALLDLIKATRPEYIEALGEGSSRQEIESSIQIHPIPEALISIYSCIAGETIYNAIFSDFIPAYEIIPLQRINDHIHTQQKVRSQIINQVGETAYHECMSWKPDMIPFLQDGCGYIICVRTLPNDESVWVLPKVSEPYKINTNLDRFILTAIECYRQEAYYQELDGDIWIWDTDEVLAKEIVRSIDPEIDNYSTP